MSDESFTKGEADALLPVLRQELERLQAAYERARSQYRELEQLRAVGRHEDRLIMQHDFDQTRSAWEASVQEVNEWIAAINERGCQLKDIEQGLIDFPSRLGGRAVLLCWRQGEDRVAYYHLPDAGYAGRRPLPPDA